MLHTFRSTTSRYGATGRNEEEIVGLVSGFDHHHSSLQGDLAQF